jgi:DNA-binding NarL/FixJ family response regulator
VPTVGNVSEICSGAVLTNREKQIAALVCEGLSNKRIARDLNVTEGTIKSHLHAVYAKLGIDSRSALMLP